MRWTCSVLAIAHLLDISRNRHITYGVFYDRSCLLTVALVGRVGLIAHRGHGRLLWYAAWPPEDH